ncbi:MAG: hypothetical protein ACM3JJ_03280 [Hyphomicrobiales bacterium]
MRNHAAILLVLTALLIPSVSALAADDGGAAPPVPLRGLQFVTVYGGAQDHAVTSVSTSPSGTETRTSGAAGYLAYRYWFAEEWAIGVTGGVLDAKTYTSTQLNEVVSRSAVMVPALLELRYAPRAIALGTNGRPFLSIGGGAYMGAAKNSVVGVSSATDIAINETKVGGRAQAGVQWMFGTRFHAEVAGGYHVVDRFSQQIGNGTKFSGFEFLAGVGLHWGGAH